VTGDSQESLLPIQEPRSVSDAGERHMSVSFILAFWKPVVFGVLLFVGGILIIMVSLKLGFQPVLFFGGWIVLLLGISLGASAFAAFFVIAIPQSQNTAYSYKQKPKSDRL